MPTPTSISELSTTAASNYPAGTESPTVLDDVSRALSAFIAQLRDGTGFTGPVTTITSLSAHPVGKMVAQVQTFATGAVATGTTVMPTDDTIPQITEGDQYMSLAFTPQNASSTLVIDVTLLASPATGGVNIAAALFQDSTANALKAAYQYQPTTGAVLQLTINHQMTAGTTSATTFRVRAGPSGANTVTFNGVGGLRTLGGVLASRITITEYLP